MQYMLFQSGWRFFTNFYVVTHPYDVSETKHGLQEPLLYFFHPTQNRAWPLVFSRLNIFVFVELTRGFFFLRPFNLNLIPFLMALMVKNLPAMWEAWVQSGVGKIPWRRAWQPTPVFLPGEPHGQRSLAGYSSWGPKQSDMTDD